MFIIRLIVSNQDGYPIVEIGDGEVEQLWFTRLRMAEITTTKIQLLCVHTTTVLTLDWHRSSRTNEERIIACATTIELIMKRRCAYRSNIAFFVFSTNRA